MTTFCIRFDKQLGPREEPLDSRCGGVVETLSARTNWGRNAGNALNLLELTLHPLKVLAGTDVVLRLMSYEL